MKISLPVLLAALFASLNVCWVGGRFIVVPYQSLLRMVRVWFRRSATAQVKEEMGGGREGRTPYWSHWAGEGLSVSRVWQTEISNGFQNALESIFVRFQVFSFQGY